MDTLPLLANTSLDARIALYGGVPVSTARFVAQAEALSRSLPDGRYIINLAENRYHFLVGWAAACLRGQIMLLPPNQGAAMLADLRAQFGDAPVFDDASATRLLDSTVPDATVLPDWRLPVDRVVAIVFTSGSTGTPQAHPKTWGSLFHNSRLATRDVQGGMARHIVATVPAQHMYGLEASLLGALSASCCVFDGKPFFPADVRAALELLPEPRTLVTTPAHLRVLAAAGTELPPLHRVVSATAPLSVDLAAQVEQLWRTGVFEIYGCTEAGVMAHRRTTSGPRWHTLDGGTMSVVDGAATYRAPQLSEATPLTDVIEPHGDTEFRLLGRAADMIKVAGKRSSLQELTRQVSSLAGVTDAAVLVPDGDERPAALVVAPGKTVSALLDALRQIMEPAFVPRPLVLVDRLPRDALGKLPRDALLKLLGRADAISIPADHPALPGHFPGHPVVPGVLLLDAVLQRLRATRAGEVGDRALRALPSLKFLSPVLPGERIELAVSLVVRDFETRAQVTGSRAGATVFEGHFVFAPREST